MCKTQSPYKSNNKIISKQHNTMMNSRNHAITINHIKLFLDTNMHSSLNNRHRVASIITILLGKPKSPHNQRQNIMLTIWFEFRMIIPIDQICMATWGITSNGWNPATLTNRAKARASWDQHRQSKQDKGTNRSTSSRQV